MSCVIDCSGFNLKFIKRGSLSGEIKFQNRKTNELFEGKFAVNYEHNSERIIIVMFIIDGVFQRTTRRWFLPQSMFIADTENFHQELSFISDVIKKSVG
ncbi:hypothetical protein HYN43_007900 [Mucilaginibacter celer]|uniref:Uncharacterized protein n=2 Tax=Mucilaginibacter celer TaxID=2305508 RepID=A0A494VNB5_9SPHI|nr:hypothetical protein HYN43_007900 [Mucilaginibacter celer]